ncbi:MULTISPECIES: TorF family putative porin [unclassified Brevundimonas]|uniref:TorF family putative porin n=1 Tax=unclassified Brevundimonas TaxID=2622653 RepID=UPI0025C740F1|nr:MULTISPECIES: TorF family putative porin [unclassified Brevundimonas]
MRLNASPLSFALLAAALTLPATAQAQSWDVSIGAGTDNRSKDASKSDGNPFVWGEALWVSADGFFYAGPAFETIKSNGSNVEVEIGGGIRPQWAGFDFDLNATHKWRLDSNPGVDDDAWEFTADMKRSIGPASARLRLQHSPDGAGSVKQWTWVSARAGWDLTEKLNASAELGYRDQTNSVSYTGYNVGVSYLLTRDLELDLRYHGTDAKQPGEQYKDALVATVAYAF